MGSWVNIHDATAYVHLYPFFASTRLVGGMVIQGDNSQGKHHDTSNKGQSGC